MTMIMMAMRTIRIRTIAPAIPPRTGPMMGWVGAADVDGDVKPVGEISESGVVGVVVGGVVVGGVVAVGVVAGGAVVGGTVVGGTVVGGTVVGGAVVGGTVVGGVVVGVTLGLGVGVVLTSDVEKGWMGVLPLPLPTDELSVSSVGLGVVVGLGMVVIAGLVVDV